MFRRIGLHFLAHRCACRYQLFDDPTISALYPRIVSRGCPAAAAGCGSQGGMLVYLTGTNLAEAGATYYCRFTRRSALLLLP